VSEIEREESEVWEFEENPFFELVLTSALGPFPVRLHLQSSDRPRDLYPAFFMKFLEEENAYES
jgi:hypothetical protein